MSIYEDDEDDIITLVSAEGEEIDFVEIAGIKIRDTLYTIMQPVELLDGMDEDEALVFKTIERPDGEFDYTIELDDDIIDEVFAKYNELLDEAEG